MIAVFTDPGIGGTFLTWSIYFLAGHEKYYSCRRRSEYTLPSNPLTNKNAHNFIPSQPRTLVEVNKALPLLKTVRQINECVYAHQFRNYNDTKEGIKLLESLVSKTVVLELSQNHVLYNCSYQQRAGVLPAFGSNAMLTNPDSIHDDFVEHFFKESIEVWKKLNLTEIWDKREFIALNFDAFAKESSISEFVSNEHFYIDAFDLWTQFETTVLELFRYLEIDISPERHCQWQSVYQRWKLLHTKRLKFVLYFDHIVTSIVNGTYFNLTPFELDIRQEAAIQRKLIYKYNLNLKTWQLTSFNDTIQLHNLLEPNPHNLS